MTALVRYDAARHALCEARKVDEVVDIRDKAEALRLYARQQHDVELEQWVSEIKLRAIRRIGEISRELEKGPSGRASVSLPTAGKSKTETLKSAGISTSAAHRAEQLASIPTKQFEQCLEQAKAKAQPVKYTDVIKVVTRKQHEVEREQRNERESASLPPVSDRYKIHHCSVADIPVDDESVDCIITDPPYPREHLPVYDDLARTAQRILKPGGSCFVMVGQSWLPEVMRALSSHLSYQWTLAYLTPGGQAVQVWPRKVNTFWKPILWFVKGSYAGDWIGDVAQSRVNDNDKRFHHWGQSESGMADLVRRASRPGDLVVDPFIGGGTTAVVALDLDRRFIGCDIDEACVSASLQRINGVLRAA